MSYTDLKNEHHYCNAEFSNNCGGIYSGIQTILDLYVHCNRQNLSTVLDPIVPLSGVLSIRRSTHVFLEQALITKSNVELQ